MDIYNDCLQLNIAVQQRNGVPFLHLSKSIYKIEEIKKIINIAWSNNSIIVFPNFYDKIKCLSSLMDKNIIRYDKEKNCYEFII